MLTEQQMKDFFQQIIDQISTLSTQAARVEGLEARVNELADRLRSVEEENNNLRNRLQEAESKNYDVQTQLSATQSSLENERAVTARLQETIVSRDTKVTEVEGNLSTEREAHRVTLSERDDARRRGDELSEQVSSFRDRLTQAEAVSHDWQERAHKAEAEVNDLKQKLDRVNAILSPLRAISGDVQGVA